MHAQRLIAAAATASLLASAILPAGATPPPRSVPRGGQAIVATGTISHNRKVRISRSGFAQITSADGRIFETRHIPFSLTDLLDPASGKLDKTSADTLVRSVDRPNDRPFAPGVVNVVFRDGVTSFQDVAVFRRSTSTASATALYTNDYRTNAAFAKLGIDRITRILRSVDRSSLSAMHSRAMALDRSVLNLANAFQIHLTAASVPQAVRELRKLPSVAYVGPDWILSTTNVGVRVLGPNAQVPQPSRFFPGMQWARLKSAASLTAGASSLPTNYGMTTSLQSYLNAPGVDEAAAYDEIEKKFHQLPGQGEIITNVSIGDVCTNPNIGISSHIIGGQHYLDVPTLPLIPEYVVDGDGIISGATEACGIDPQLGEVLLDFSVMAPLPHDRQRAGEMGTGLGDLIGIAPGAQYRLVVPGGLATVSALLETFVAAANQTPQPNVISASIGFGLDAQGFPSRYLEEEPILRSAISTFVNAQNIVVCISAGDGLRIFTNAAVSPTGGSAPTNLAQSADQQTNINDIANSTAPSAVLDSGAISVGGSTTDDIFSANPQDPANAIFVNHLAFPEVRWNGAQGFSSGFGSRVNIAAPSDNIPSMSLSGLGFDQVNIGLNGGTSASAPMTAAAAAIMLQVARLTGRPLAKATDVRDLLVSTAVALPNVPQADMPINVGPQLSVRRGVEKLLANAGQQPVPSIARVAIAQRQLVSGASACGFSGPGGNFSDQEGDSFVEATDPTYIRLDGIDACGQIANKNLNAPITIAPDWEGMTPSAHYRLYISGHPNRLLANGPWARLWPRQIFEAAGLSASSPLQRTVSLTYDVVQGFHQVASATFDLTFGPAPAASKLVPAPLVAPVITGPTMSVSYDFSDISAAYISSPVIEVSQPGRMSPDSGPIYYPLYVSPVLTARKGTLQIPVSALGGGGMYGIAINLAPNPSITGFGGHQDFSTFAFTRVVAGSSARPAAPLLSLPGDAAAGIAPTHGLSVPHGSEFVVSFDVSNVPGATNAALEISSSGPNLYGNQNPFNNPNGSVADDNGADTGSVVVIPLSGTRGTVTLTGRQAHLVQSMSQVVRVLPRQGLRGVGEASDVSSISEAGIMAPDGNDLSNGFAINSSGDDGVYTSQGPLVEASFPGSLLGSFSQSTGATTIFGLVPVGQPYALLGGYVGSDTAVWQTGSTATSPATLGSAQVTTFANLALGYSPPIPAGWKMIEAGQNAVNQTSAVLCATGPGFTTGRVSFGVFTANVRANTATPFITLAPPFPVFAQNFAVNANIDYDAGANTGYVTIESEPVFGFGPSDDVLAIVNFTAGTVTYKDLGDLGGNYDFVIDRGTHVGAMSSNIADFSTGVFSNQVVIIDLKTGNISSTVVLPGASFIQGAGITKLAVDPFRHLFAVQNMVPQADDTDNNPLSEVDFVSEAGQVISKSSRLYNLTGFTLSNHWFQLNPQTRTGFMFGPDVGYAQAEFDQIVPFSY